MKEIQFPKHKCGLCLEHNPQRNSYDSVQEYLEAISPLLIQFRDEESKQICIDADELWILAWNPYTPVGSIAVAGSTLQECLELAGKDER